VAHEFLGEIKARGKRPRYIFMPPNVYVGWVQIIFNDPAAGRRLYHRYSRIRTHSNIGHPCLRLQEARRVLLSLFAYDRDTRTPEG
jgi:hypothetical protein